MSDALVELQLCELEQKPLGAVGGMILAGLLPAATKLRLANLEDAGLCGADNNMSGFRLLVESLPQTKIRRLNLSSNGLGDAGALALAAVLRRCPLTHLYLAGNELCGVNMFRSGTHVTGGLKALCEEMPQTQIELLDLSFNSIRDTGGAHVVAMLEIPDDTPYLSCRMLTRAVLAVAGLGHLARGALALAHGGPLGSRAESQPLGWAPRCSRGVRGAA